MKIRIGFLILALCSAVFAYAQPAAAPQNWFHLDPVDDGFPGVSAEKTYQNLLKGQKGETVVVAVLDSGVDAEHEDLKDIMWVNQDEIPGNGIDDDRNGYIDDVHGWNFLGNAKGENVHHDNLEAVRLFVIYEEKFKDVDPSKLSKKEKAQYAEYEEIKDDIEQNREELQQNVMLYGTIADAFRQIEEAIGKEDITQEDLDAYEPEEPVQQRAKMVLANIMAQGQTFQEVNKELQEIAEYFSNRYNYNYNTDFDPRALVGDNYNDATERYYGNNDVEGPDANHGTHVAGIIAAERNNDIGMDGVADNVRIMSVRTVPDGDERDKDVANAIRYAVDNGASIINMSFGKGYSPGKGVVDDAVRYAQKNDVLIVHAAGNDSKLNTTTNTFPNDTYLRKGFFSKLFGAKYADNWIEVGALNWEGEENRAAGFSNYSPEHVDVFAPGVDIYSTIPNDEYEDNQGTSMASPVVAGVAAVLRSYFPDLTATQIREIILQSTNKEKGKVIKPGTEESVAFSELAQTGGSVNLFQAVELAIQTKGKKKGKKRVMDLDGKLKKDSVVVP